jgi:hypothetical protein
MRISDQETPGPPPPGPGPRFPFPAESGNGGLPDPDSRPWNREWGIGRGKSGEIPRFPRKKTGKRGIRESGFLSEDSEHQLELQWTRNKVLSREYHAVPVLSP